jgi:hypothetical protein
VAPASAAERTRLWTALIRADAERLAQRARFELERHGPFDAAFEMAERDSEVGGGIIAGALAYRLFIWLLPLALIAVAGLGIAADASSRSPEEATKSLGLEGLISNSIANAANSPNRWYALVIGIPVLIWATRSVLRVLIGAAPARLDRRSHRSAEAEAGRVTQAPRLILVLRPRFPESQARCGRGRPDPACWRRWSHSCPSPVCGCSSRFGFLTATRRGRR